MAVSAGGIEQALAASMPALARQPQAYRVLDADGQLCGPEPDLTSDELRGLYRWMLFGRLLDERGLQLQRQGRIGVWGPMIGQEAAQAGLGLAMQPGDWVFPSYREALTLCMRGLALSDLLAYYRGLYWVADPAASGVFPIQIMIGDQTLHAVGAGIGFALQGQPHVAVAAVGDGATSQGDFLEGLNFAGVFKAQTVIFVQNNQWAISVPRERQTASETLAQKALGQGVTGVLVDGNDALAVYAISHWALERARAGEGAVLIEALTYRLGAHTTADDPRRYQPDAEIELWRARDPLPRLRRYLERRGLWDAASEATASAEILAEIDTGIAGAEALTEPTYASYVEACGGRRAEGVMVQAINRALAQALEADPRVVVMGQDVGQLGGVFRATDGLHARFGSKRVFDTPLAESAIVGTAFGMALTGLRPVAEIQFMGFLYKCSDQLIAQAAQIRARTWGQTTAPLVVRTAYGGGVRTPEHHSDSLEGLLVSSPGVKVVVPSTALDAAGLLLSAIDDPDPVVVMEPIRLYRAARDVLPDRIEPVPLGQARIRRPGGHVTLVAWGALVAPALDAADQAARAGIEAEVIDLRTLSPLDWDTLGASVDKTGRLVVVHEAPRTGGPGAELVANLVEHCFYALRSPPRRVAGDDVVYPPQLFEDEYLPNAARILAALRQVMSD